MINRLVAENTIKVPLRGQINFSVNKKFIAFTTDNCLRIKTLNREAKDVDIPISQPPLQFSLSQVHPWALLLTANHLLEIYLVEYLNGIIEGTFKKVAILHNVEQYAENRDGITIVALNKTLKNLTYK